MVHPRIIIIGAGIVGTSLADELTMRGASEVTVLDSGPLFETGGSTSHAPGLVFQTNPSRTMATFAQYTVEKFAGLTYQGKWCFNSVGGLEVAQTPERMRELHRRHGLAQSWGIPGEIIDVEQCVALHPLIDPAQILGGFHTPTDGLAKAVRAAAAQADRATERGAKFIGNASVVEVLTSHGRVSGVRTADGTEFNADVVISCAGFWGAELGKTVGLTVPLVPMAHQYARTDQIAALIGADEVAEASLPILRHQDHDLYYREHGDRIGIGYYGHRAMPVDMAALDADTGGEPMPSMLPFTADDFAPAWQESVALLPALGDAKVDEGFNGIFSFTPDGGPIMGEHRDLPGFWVAEAVWVTHSAGVARTMAEWVLTGTPDVDVHECDIHRFEDVQLAPEFVLTTSSTAFDEVYDILHPHQFRAKLRGLRTSPFYQRHQAAGAFFFEGGGWERPAWFESNAGLLDDAELMAATSPPDRDDWAAQFYSPISVAEAAATRRRVALYDMTPLTRLEVSGPGALEFLQHLATNKLDKSVGSVTYALLLDELGGIRSDVTIARLAPDRFQVGANGPLDLDWLHAHAPASGVNIRDITDGTCCLGLWGPRARDVLAPLVSADISHSALKYFRAVETYIGAIPVLLVRVSCVGELGWEIYTNAASGLALYDRITAAGEPHGLINAGRIAFNSLRMEKGYRSYGTDMTTDDVPAEAGLSFAVRPGLGNIGADNTERVPVRRQLRTLIFDAADSAGGEVAACPVALGREPVYLGSDSSTAAAGYVTSAAYSATLNRQLAYAWLPAQIATGAAVTVRYFDTDFTATIADDPVVDPDMKRILR